MSAVPGYFGKVVTHGDFVRRRLPPDFVAGWDRWLQAALQHGRRELGLDWPQLYMNSPLWRFALGAGVCGSAAMCGVLVPNVDRVGRHFPLTLARPMGGGGAPWPELFGRGAAWFDAMAALALDSVAPGFSLDLLDEGLARLGESDAAPACAVQLGGTCMLWTDMTASSVPLVRVYDGLPVPQAFCALLLEADQP